MSQKQRIGVALVALFLFVLCAIVWADSDPGKIECLPEQPSLISLEGDELPFKAGVPRNQILLEIFARTT
ncbi:MAG: hypothetical protein KAX39_02740 [candidate division Zixibacteria bacterium]|nr:hypothetical protein [candidate division Zixibacteria bacterium]